MRQILLSHGIVRTLSGPFRRVLGLCLLILLAAAPASATRVLDIFSTGDYSGNYGNVAWSGDWEEYDSGAGPDLPYVQVLFSDWSPEGHSLLIGAESGIAFSSGGVGCSRGADLSGAMQAQLNFDYRRRNGLGGVRVFASDNGGDSWSQIADLSWAASDPEVQSLSLDVSAYISADFEISFFGTVQTNEADPDGGIYIDNVQVSFFSTAELVDLSLSMSADRLNPALGEDVIFTLDLSNVGPGDASDITVEDILPDGLDYQGSVAESGSYEDGLWTLAFLESGQSCTLEISCTVRDDYTGTQIVNTASITDLNEGDSQPDNNSDSVTLRILGSSLVMTTGNYWGQSGGRTISGLGFAPDLLIIKCNGSYPTVIGSSTMPEGQSKVLPGGDSIAGDMIVSLDTDGFEVGSHNNVCRNGWEYNWVAFAAAEGALRLGSYTGDGFDGREITGLGFEPAYMLIVPEEGQACYQRFAGQSGDVSLPFDGGVAESNCIQALLADGFQVGDAGAVNKTGNGYHYIAWGSVGGQVSAGAYNGNGNDNRDIHDISYQPEYVLLKGSGEWGAHRPASLSGDLAMRYGYANHMPNLIQSLDPFGFQVGDNSRVNRSAVRYFYATFANAPPNADLRLAMAANDNTPGEGDTVVFTLRLYNDGPDDNDGIEISDLLPTGLNFVSAVLDQGGYDSIFGLWTVGALAAGDSLKLALSAEVAPGTAGTLLVNTAGIAAADLADLNPANDSASVGVVVQADGAFSFGASMDTRLDENNPDDNYGAAEEVKVRLKVNDQKRALYRFDIAAIPSQATVQSSFLQLHVNGNDDTGDPVEIRRITDDWAEASATWSNTAADFDTAVWASFTPLVTGQITIDVKDLVQAWVDGTYPNYGFMLSATSDAEESKYRTKEHDIVGERPVLHVVTNGNANLSLGLAVDNAQPNEGDLVTYEITVTNTGPHAASTVLVNDLLPGGLTLQANTPSQGEYNSGNGNWSVGNLGLGAVATLTLSAWVDVGTGGSVIANGADILSADQFDTDPSNNSASVNIDIQSADLGVGIVVDDPVPTVGDEIIYTITLVNSGPDAASGVELSDLLPETLFLENAMPSQGSYDGETGVWNVGGLGAGSSVILMLAATVGAAAAGEIVANSVLISAADQADPASGNNQASVDIDVQSADLSVTLDCNQAVADVGDILLFTVTVTNNGPDTAAGIALLDSLPGGLTWQSDMPSQGDYDETSGLWAVGTLLTGTTATLTINANVDSSAAGGSVSNVAELSASDVHDPDGGNNADSRTVTVRGADLALDKQVDDGAPSEGDTINYSIILSNAGPDDATIVQVLDLLPAGVTHASHVASQGSYDVGSGLWDIGAVAVGEADTLSIECTVNIGLAEPVISNVAVLIGGDPVDPNTDNNQAAADIAVGAVDADLSVSIGVDDANPTVGDVIAYQITLQNAGPDAATGIVVADVLPSGLNFVSAAPSQGAYRDNDGLWAVGSLAASANAVLLINAQVQAGTIGETIVNEVSIAAADQADPDADNNLDSVDITVRGGDLALAGRTDAEAPEVLQELRVTFLLSNAGPDAVGGIEVAAPLPEGLSFLAAGASQGAYDDGTGVWTLGTSAVGQTDSLEVDVQVEEAAAGTQITYVANLSAADLADPEPANDTAQVLLDVQALPSADIALSKQVSDPTPAAGQQIVYLIQADNNGPDFATGVQIGDLLPPGLSLLSILTSQGSYNGDTGIWSLGNLAVADGARLYLTVEVGELAEGVIVSNSASLLAVSPADPNADNDIASVDFTVTEPEAVFVTATQSPVTLLANGQNETEVLYLTLMNNSAQPETLRALTLHNTASGPGSQAQLDADWTAIKLIRPLDFDVHAADGRATAEFADGVLTFSGLNLPLPVEETVVLRFQAGAALSARDGDLLDLELTGDADILLAGDSPLEVDWPLSPAGAFIVDGMSADQILLPAIGSSYVMTASSRNPIFRATLPPNGYEADLLEKFNVSNWGQAGPEDITLMELWADDGDGDFDAAADTLITELFFTGDRWERSGLSHTVPVAGLTVHISVDIADLAVEGRTINLGFPVDPNDTAIGVASGNDGPLDRQIVSDDVYVITAEDRIAFSAQPLPDDVINPGQRRVLMLQMTASNSYDEPRVLQGLAINNAGTGQGGQAELAGAFASLQLWRDAGELGVFEDEDIDTLLGIAYFPVDGGPAVFTNFAWELTEGGGQQHLFVTGDYSVNGCADGDRLGLNIADLGDLEFTTQTVVAAAWPLDSGARFTVDGMVAAQIINYGAPVVTLGPGEGPVLAFDIGVPANGYAQDWLQHVTVQNFGTAEAGDINELHLWRDDGDGVFNGGPPDIDLFALAESDGDWQSRLFSYPVGSSGARLFVSLSASVTLSDSVTVQLALPLDGIRMQSGNNGPIDSLVVNEASQLLSSAPLLATLNIDPSGSTLGQTVAVTMELRNISEEDVVNIAPEALSDAGDGLLTLISGPLPATMSLTEGARDTFRWEFTATGAGEVTLSGSAAGTGDPSGLERLALPSSSNTHRIFVQADSLALVAAESMPLWINQGQDDIVPFHFTFSNEAGEGASSVQLRSLSIELRDMADQGVVPADLLETLVLKEGAQEYLRLESFPSSGALVDLDLSSYVQIGNQEPVTLALQLDILPETIVPTFQVRIASGAWLDCVDATSGAPVEVYLSEAVFPLESGFAHIGAPPESLSVSLPPASDLSVSQGQEDAPLLALAFDNHGVDGITSDIRISRFAVGLCDGDGLPLPVLAEWLSRIRLEGNGETYLDCAVELDDGGAMALDLAAQLIVPVNETVELLLSGDIQADADLAALRMLLLSDSLMVARDVVTGDSVPVTYAAPQMQGGLVSIEAPAENILLKGLSGLPPALIVGEQDVDALILRLKHGGGVGGAGIRCGGLRVDCRDSREPSPPGAVIDRVTAWWDGGQVASLSDLSAVETYFDIPLPDLFLAGGDSVDLAIRIDLESSAPAGGLELRVGVEGWALSDWNSGAQVLILPAAGQSLPLSSNLAWLESPARNLAVGLESRLPAVLAADGGELPFALLRLENLADEDAGDILLDHLILRAADREGHGYPLGEAAVSLSAWLGDELWAECADLPPDSLSGRLVAGQVLVVEPGLPVELELRAALRPGATRASLRLGLWEDGIGVVQPANPLLAVQVQGAEGQIFPLWTQQGNFTALNLKDSFSNFPNPFRVGVELSRFAYYLSGAAQVTLQIWTPRGELVRTIADAEPRPAGLNQIDGWDGLNGRGKAVLSGVYLAELRVDYDSGGRDRLLRKVAVLR